MANRPRDIEDCAALASAKMHFEAIYSEIEAQYARAGTVEEKIRITYMEEGIGKLEEDYRMQVDGLMTEQNRKYVTKEIGKLLSDTFACGTIR